MRLDLAKKNRPHSGGDLIYYKKNLKYYCLVPLNLQAFEGLPWIE